MKLLLAFILLGYSAMGFASVDADGCYVTYVTGAMYPALCVSGSNEEAAVPTTRIAIFGTNTDTVIWCAKVDSQRRLSSKKNANHVQFGFDHQTGMKSIVIKGEQKNNHDESGDLTFNEVEGSLDVNYSRLDKETTTRLLKKMYESEKCDQL